MQNNIIKLGKYRHYKGKEYRMIGVAKHTETHEDMVVYEPLYESDFADMMVRPRVMFEEFVEYKGKKVARFVYIGE